MSMKYLGDTFDIHTGGVDNIFPHHENEIAQSESATGKLFVRCWLHCEHLLVDGEKMSKSKGNFYTLVDLLDKDLDPQAIRYFLLSAHYRKQLNFTLRGVSQASAALMRLEDFQNRLDREPPGNACALNETIEQACRKFDAALDDDLNTAGALGTVFDLLREANAAFDKEGGSAEERESIRLFFDRFRYVFGINDHVVNLTDEIEQLIQEREKARQAHDFAASDSIRDDLLRRGIVLEDTPQGVRWKRKT